jgi:hypothetical protein
MLVIGKQLAHGLVARQHYWYWATGASKNLDAHSRHGSHLHGR